MTSGLLPASSSPAGEAVWRAAALRAAVGEALASGADSAFVIAPYPLPDEQLPGLLGTAVRDGDPQPTELGEILSRALGREALARAAVVFIDCFALVPAWTSAQEVATLVDRCAAVVIVERVLELVELPDPVTLLANFGIVSTDDKRIATVAGPARRVLIGDRRSPKPRAGGLDVFVMDWNGKARVLVDALVALGHRLVTHPGDAQVAMINNDYPGLGRLPYLEACVENGGRAYLYPDGAASTLMAAWDGLYEPYPHLSGVIATAPGHVEVARRYGYPFPVYEVGWSLCALRPRRTGTTRSVLFAPEHPPYHGNARPLRQNAEIFDALLESGAEVTVRFLGDLAENGLRRVSGVRYVNGGLGDFGAMIEQIDAHDAVVSSSTFACLAVARGVTTVMWNSDVQYHHETNRVAEHMDLYRDYVRYPFEINSGEPLVDLLARAAADEEEVASWRARFIGDPLDADRLTAAICG